MFSPFMNQFKFLPTRKSPSGTDGDDILSGGHKSNSQIKTTPR